MKINKKLQMRRFTVAVAFALPFAFVLQNAHAEEKTQTEQTPAEAPAAKPAIEQGKEEPSQPANASPTAKPSQSTQVTSNIETAQRASEWVYQMRAGFGAGKSTAVNNFKSDRLGAALYAGRLLPNLELPLPFIKSKGLSGGLTYQTFSGVDTSVDLSWVMQSLGAQVQFIIDPIANNMDVALQAGLVLQRQVGEEPNHRNETRKYGAGLSAGGFLRIPVLENIYAIGGADLVLGSSSWFSIAGGLESHF
ncbi:hypothetical protein EBU99_13145 [bacterium]|nr:hypothetical protein [bacterium]